MAIRRAMVLAVALMLALLCGMTRALGDGVYFATTSLPTAMAGIYYHTRVEVSGENIPYVITLTQNPAGDNEFPSELAITEDGVIYGTPLAAGVYPFSLQVAYGVAMTRFCVLELVVEPFSQDALDAGGTDTGIIGDGNDTLTGVANGLNGGRVTMEAGQNTAFFVNPKGMLYSSDEPYKNSSEMFSAPEYRWLDSIGTNLYYYQRYYQAPTPAATHLVKGTYITRICRDPIYTTGRKTLTELNDKYILDLAVTDRVVVYILGEEKGIIHRVPLEGGTDTSIRCYHNAKELQPDRVLPYNGYAYLLNWADGMLYRVMLDGQIADKLTDTKVSAYTISRIAGEDALFYADASGALYYTALSGGQAEALGGIKAKALNSDAEYLYYANARDNNRLYRVMPDAPESAEKLSDMAVSQIYVFDDKIAVQKQGGTELYVLSLDGSGTAVRLGK
jgi:hypothetical protein